MKKSMIVVDDFSPDALSIRDTVVAEGFGTEKGPDGLDYTGINQHQFPQLIALLEKAVERKVLPRLSCFRLNLAGENPHSWIHSDDICAKYASVLYLNLPGQCQGGTAFWTHTGLGIDRMPSAEDLKRAGYSESWFCTMMKREWNDLTFWKQNSFVGMKFNRFITYPTSLFHSRFPFDPFGTSAVDGRLIWVCFYDVIE